jgi:hypothetical protein
MNYPLVIDGFEGQNLEVKSSGFWAGPQLLVNGQPAPKGPRRGQMLLHRSDGSEAIATWKPAFLGLEAPAVAVDGKVINVIEPLKWYERVWSALPVALVIVGGILGAIIGLVAFVINTKIFRGTLNPVLKFVLTAVVSVAAVLLYVLVTVLLFGDSGGS